MRRSYGAHLIALCVGMALVLAVYHKVVHYDFVSWDDGAFVYANPHLQPVTKEGLRALWTSHYKYLYAPLTYSVWALVARFDAGNGHSMHTDTCNPAIYHALNLGVHLAAFGMVYWLLFLLCGHVQAALVGALLFALHPLGTASVAWVSQLKGLLVTLFGTGALCLYVLFLRRHPEPPHTKGSWRHLLLWTSALVMYTAALLCKASALMLPAAAMLIGHTFLHCRLSRLMRTLWPWFLLSMVCMVIARLSQVTTLSRYEYTSPFMRILVFFDSLAHYVYKTVWPVSLCIDYGRHPEYVVNQAWYHIFWIVPAAGLVIAVLVRQKAWVGLTCLALFGVLLFPTLGLFSFQFQYFSTVADRYAYGALLAPGLGMAWYLRHTRHWAVWAAAAAMVCVMAFLAFQQAATWRNDQTLYTHTRTVNPDSFLAAMNLGSHMLNQEEEIDRAEQLFLQAVRRRPRSELGYYNLGLVFERRQEWAKALRLFLEASRLRPQRGDIHFRIGLCYRALGRPLGAIRHLYKALETESRDPDVHLNLGLALCELGRFDKAVPCFTRAHQLRPRKTLPLLERGKARAMLDRPAMAKNDFLAVLSLQPDHAEARRYLAQVDARLAEEQESE